MSRRKMNNKERNKKTTDFCGNVSLNSEEYVTMNQETNVLKEEFNNAMMSAEVLQSKAGDSSNKMQLANNKLITFDAYFSALQAKNPAIKSHHKEPMKAYLLQKGLKKLAATKQAFDEILKNY